jgi:hypothetical protein
MTRETIRRHPVGIICSNSSPLARQPAVRPSFVAMTELVVYRARQFPEYHQWVSKILRVSQGRLIVIQECADVLSVIAAVESGRGAAVVREFITPVAGDRVRFVQSLNEAINLLRQLNVTNSRRVPDNASRAFVRQRWLWYIFTDDGIDRRYYELCVMAELKNALRSGDIWIHGSRQFRDFEDYLLSRDRFAAMRSAKVCFVIGLLIC